MTQPNELAAFNNQSQLDAQAPLRCDYVLAALRSAVLHARLIENEAIKIGIALKSGYVSANAALLWARDAGVLELVDNEDIEAAALRGSTPSHQEGCDDE